MFSSSSGMSEEICGASVWAKPCGVADGRFAAWAARSAKRARVSCCEAWNARRSSSRRACCAARAARVSAIADSAAGSLYETGRLG